MVVGSGSEHGQKIKDSMLRANEIRDQFLSALATNSTNFSVIVELSKSGDYKALSSLKLSQCLVSRPGWSEATARQALDDQGFDLKDTVRNIRKNPGKVELFSKMMEVPPDRWKARPVMPDGWPWFGKLSSLVNEENGITPPEELSAILESFDDGESVHGTEDEEIDDMISSLLED